MVAVPEGERKREASTGRPLMEMLGAARVNVLVMYWVGLLVWEGMGMRMGKKGGEGAGDKKYLVDHLFDPHAKLIFLVVVAVGDGRERSVDAICCGASHIVDEVGKVFWCLEFDPPVGDVHFCDCS